jgi:DNA-binding response OmpR family regulator
MPDTPSKEFIPTVLVVDDQQVNVRLLERKLQQNKLRVICATSGEKALELANNECPDVILLDIMMPGMDGIDVCKVLKENSRTKDIPVIFVTARTSKEGKIEGLGAGAADYLIKPIDLDETIARVRTQIRIIENHRENIRLTQELEESRRQTAIMNLTEGIAHNLNNLLGVTVGYLSLLRRSANNPERILKHCDNLDAAIKRMTRIVHQLTIIGQFDSIQTESFPLHMIISKAIARFHRIGANKANVTQHIDLPIDFRLITNAELLEACIERLLLNAYESYQMKDPNAQPPSNGITIECHKDEEAKTLTIDILDIGAGVPFEIKDNIFEPFVSSFPSVGKGMGLTIVRHSIRSLQGTVSVTPREGNGTRARLVLPLNKPASEMITTNET